MADTAVQTPESATGTEGHSDFVSLKSGASPSQSKTEAKDALASERETPEESKGLTDEQKADRKRRNDERRERRWYQERGEMRAEMNRLKSELQELKQGRGESTSQPMAGEPVFNEYLNSGKFKTWEDAQAAYMRDYTKFVREQVRAEGSHQSAQSDEKAVRTQFNKNIREFSRTHHDFDDAFEAVQDVLDGDGAKGNAVTTYLVKNADGPALIYFLGNDPDRLQEIADMDPDDAIAELGAIRKELKAQASSKQKDNDDKGGTKPPGRVAGRGAIPDSITAMRQASERNDFTAFRQAKRAARQK